MANEYNGNEVNGNGYHENGNGDNGYHDKKPIFNQKTEFVKIPMQIDRYFTQEGKSPFVFDMFGRPIKWLSESVTVTDDMGKVVFTQPNVRRPDFWSALAIKVVASKYFWGDQLKGERENSAEQLVGRVSRFIGRQALKQGYFDENKSNILENEVASICLNQLCVFNSPVWFNAGINEYNPEAGGVSAYIWDSQTESAIKSHKGMDRPQCSACFILSIEDNMDSIMAVQVAEANLFKAGSGTGTNRSPLRSSKERLTGGGRASGPVSFMKGYDAYAGIIKSGGKTRRAAKMEILNIDHPDIIEFIESKQKEEKKAWALIEQGYTGGMNGEAYGSVAFQNCNMSVRVSDEFMEQVKKNGEWNTLNVIDKKVCETHKARDILNKIAEGTWICGDPGVQCDGVIQKYHTCKNSGRINATNPCVTGDTKVLMKDGKWRRIDSFLEEEIEILTNTGIIAESMINGSFSTGKKPVYRLTTKSGYEIKLTADHKVFTVNRGFIQACELTKDDYVLLPNYQVGAIIEPKDKTFYQMVGVYLGDGHGNNGSGRGIQITMDKENERPILEKFAEYVGSNYERITHQNHPATVRITPTSCKYQITNIGVVKKFSEVVNLSLLGHQKCISEHIFNLPLGEQKYILQGLFTADGTVANYGEKAQYVSLDSTSLQLLKDVQILLLGFGIKSKLYKNRRAGKLKGFLPDGNGGLKEYDLKEMNSLRISRSGRIKFEKLIGFMPESKKAEKLRKLNEQVSTYNDKPFDAINTLEYIGEEEVYDLTEPLTHSFVANGVTIHNCSEYLFLDDTACNLASINLLKFRSNEGGFDVEGFKKVVKYFISAMDILVDGASYPTEKIAERSHIFRTLGLGYANLGALLMSLGLPYDSEEGRAVAAAITAIMCGEAYKTSAELARMVGPFPGFMENRDSMLEVIKMQRNHVKDIDVEKIPADLRDLVNVAWDCWSEALEIGEKYGFRNAQVCVLAPTGTIAFLMDCDTTGIEPDIALVKYKVLSGGGMLKIINRSVALALERLGYSQLEIKDIINYIDKNDTIEGAPNLREEHLPVFDCAFKAAKGKRSIEYKGHIDMMAVTQPFISGAISKTVNMPEESTVEDIANAYIYAWEKKLKAVAIYRENSKRSQPLNTKRTEGEMVKRTEKVERVLVRERIPMPQTRKSLTHKFEIAGHTGFLTVGLYDDGRPGEIFVTMSKQGSTIRGLMDAWARSISMNLQYGASVNDLFGKFRHQKFEPAGFVKNEGGGSIDNKIKAIRTASSFVDYVSQFMLNNFGESAAGIQVEVSGDLETQSADNVEEEQAMLSEFGNEGLICGLCGGPAKRIGNCAIRCTSCNQTQRSGCGE
ncbi:MAG: LAGLIDADG family homing endonuclease [Nanoarchaeota archaeon]|nr:LAGLIDADG family homing endonuclease [Nanoarchaeota archaeon]